MRISYWYECIYIYIMLIAFSTRGPCLFPKLMLVVFFVRSLSFDFYRDRSIIRPKSSTSPEPWPSVTGSVIFLASSGFLKRFHRNAPMWPRHQSTLLAHYFERLCWWTTGKRARAH